LKKHQPEGLQQDSSLLPIVTSQPTTGERNQNPSELKLNLERGAPWAV